MQLLIRNVINISNSYLNVHYYHAECKIAYYLTFFCTELQLNLFVLTCLLLAIKNISP